MRAARFVRFVAAAACAGGFGVGLFALPASAAPQQTAHGITIQLDFSNNPTTTLNPPWGPLTIPGTCPFDGNAFFTITGNAVLHQTGNNNGFWGGETIEGAATISEPELGAIFTGHGTAWTGFGTNMSESDTSGQVETGLTFDLQGVSPTGQALTVHIDWHGTMNNNGSITAMTTHFACS